MKIPLVAADILFGSPFGRVNPAQYINEARLKSIALQYQCVFIPARSEAEVALALDEGRIADDDLIPAEMAVDFDIELLYRQFGSFFEVAPEQVAQFLRPLPVDANRLVSRSLYRGLEYGAQSQLPGFPEIDLWSSSIQALIVRQRGQDAFDRFRTPQAMRDRMIASWLWLKDGIPTITDSSLLFAIVAELTALNLTLNADLLKDERPLIETIREWVGRYLAEPRPENDKVASEPIGKLVPNCSSLSWQQVFRLRERDGFQQYLQMTEGFETVTSVEQTKALLEKVNNQLFALVAEAVPKPTGVACEGILEEVAGWFLPGVGIASPVKEVYEARKRRRDYSAIFWLQDARKAAQQ